MGQGTETHVARLSSEMEGDMIKNDMIKKDMRDYIDFWILKRDDSAASDACAE